MNPATSETFLASLRATARLKAQDIAEDFFKNDDLLYVAEAGNVPAQPGLARSFGKTVAEKAVDMGFELGRQAERDLALMSDGNHSQRQSGAAAGTGEGK